jgi:hypothetical protein
MARRAGGACSPEESDERGRRRGRSGAPSGQERSGQARGAARAARAAAFAVAVGLCACGPTARPASDDRRGDTNGRMFDFVSHKPDGSEWTVRIRGDSMWIAFSTATDHRELGPTTLAAGQARKLWTLIDDVAIGDDEEADGDEEVGSVLLRIRDPSDDGDHDIVSIYVPRDTRNETVIDLASYLIDLAMAHHRIEPAF